MRLIRYDRAAALLQVAEPLLRRTEAKNALIYGILRRLDVAPELYGEPYLASLQDDQGACVALALRTPPFVMVITALPPGGQERLLADLLRAGQAPSGVLGPDPTVSGFAAAWAEATGRPVRPTMWQRAYRLDRVQPPDVAGRLRACAEQDRDLVEAWTQGFVTDLGIHGAEQMAPLARHAFDTGGFHLWEHEGAPRAMAALVGETPRGARIGFVYTPPELRRRGYGAACTAAVSQHTLDAGKAFCCLNADLGNPAANSIYQRIGYRPVGDLREILFDPNPAGIAGTSRG